MCGICGKYDPSGPKLEEITRMLGTIAHRGPDDEGIYINGRIGLGNRRLSIIDIPGGKQPISNEDGTVWIVYNGEIYNYRALRQILESKGHQFQTQSDTEVIVHLYEEYGENCVERLRGMFAFAIWDVKLQKLMLARDRLGQKPLFYSQEGGDFFFASEIKAILAASQETREIDYLAVHHYLSLRFIPPPHTILKNIKKLPPAHVLIFQDGEIRTHRYWSLSFQEKLKKSESEFVNGLRGKLDEVVALHLVSDVPVGAFLSGGLDSSMIVAMLSQDLDISLQTFAVGVQEDDFNELPYARQVAEHCSTNHTEECVASNLIQLLPRMIWHLDEPSDPIAACMYHAANLASRHVKVVLGGDGGDELFAGFDRYRGNGYVNAYALLPSLIRQQIMGPVLSAIPDSFTYKSTTQKLRWAHQLSFLSSPGKRYAEATCFFRFCQEDKRDLFGEELWNHVGDVDSSQVIIDRFNETDSDDLIDRMLYADFMTRLPEHSLMLTDRMTMAHSLEARSPFLDHELVEYLAAFPSHFKIHGQTTKYLLRKLAVDYLPKQIVNRQKQGFMFPIAYWFRNELSHLLENYLLKSYFVGEGIFRESSVSRLIEEHRSGRIDHHVRLWMLLNLEIWHRMYIQEEGIGSIEQGLFVKN
jgi:asparagine synthase (glutamine-hydrolysing)